MQGLYILYSYTGRWAEFESLVKELTPDFVDEKTGGPKAGLESDWTFLNDYRVRLMQEARNWEGAARLQFLDLDTKRKLAAPYLQLPEATLDEEGRAAIRSLAVLLNELGLTARESGKPECVAMFGEVIELAACVDDKSLQASGWLNQGVSYLTRKPTADLDQAERCLRRGYELVPNTDRLGQSKFLSELGFIAYERFKQAIRAKEPETVSVVHLNDAKQRYEQALSLTPTDALDSVAVKHTALGPIYSAAGLIDLSMNHFREAIRLYEKLGATFHAGVQRYAAAVALAQAGRVLEARDYAHAALDDFEHCKDYAWVQTCAGLLQQIEKQLTHG